MKEIINNLWYWIFVNRNSEMIEVVIVFIIMGKVKYSDLVGVRFNMFCVK